MLTIISLIKQHANLSSFLIKSFTFLRSITVFIISIQWWQQCFLLASSVNLAHFMTMKGIHFKKELFEFNEVLWREHFIHYTVLFYCYHFIIWKNRKSATFFSLKCCVWSRETFWFRKEQINTVFLYSSILEEYKGYPLWVTTKPSATCTCTNAEVSRHSTLPTGTC